MDLFALSNAMAVICDADFNTRFPHIREHITDDIMQELIQRLEGGECKCTAPDVERPLIAEIH
ncbi:MAG: hypothetical protein K0Q87_5556 [Neobacillus sp.]|nr:hypothetical protein [Neobacillus sp.]